MEVIPVVSVVIDAISIFCTWTKTNETLQRADSLCNDIQKTTIALRGAAEAAFSNLESLAGNADLRVWLRRLIRLQSAIPGSPAGPREATVLSPIQSSRAICLT